MLAGSQKRRLFQRNQDVQDVERHQTRGYVLGAPGDRKDILRRHARPAPEARLDEVNRRLVDDVEIAGSPPGFRECKESTKK